MRIYELGFILKPDLSEPDVSAAIDGVKQALTDGGAGIDKVDDWGKRRLAYRVRGFWNGHYVFIQYSTTDGSSLTREVERRLRVADNIIKFMTIRIDEDLKRVRKLRERRAKRAPQLDAKAVQPDSAPAKPQSPGMPEPAKPATPENPAAGAPPAKELGEERARVRSEGAPANEA